MRVDLILSIAISSFYPILLQARLKCALVTGPWSSNLILDSENDIHAYVHGFHIQTFFGGSFPDWGSPKDQHAWFRASLA